MMGVDSKDPALVPLPVIANVAPNITVAARVSRRQRAKSVGIALLRSKTFMLGAVIMLFWILDAIFWPLIVPRDPFGVDAINTLTGPSSAHWFGTDDLGRDVFSRVLAGAR
ncbi:MAG: hypothetical protein ACR2GA_06770, partial [Chloroflexota bacterium]